MEPGGSMPHSEGPSNNHYRRIDTYSFKIQASNLFPIEIPSTASVPTP